MKTRYSGKSFKDSSTMKKSKLSIREKRNDRFTKWKKIKKAELDSEIWKKHQKKEAKDLKKIWITIFLLTALIYGVKFLMGFFK